MENYSYEDIYELLRTEKYSTDLQPLGKEELQKIKSYLDGKKKLAEKQTEGSAFYDSSTKYKVDTELENAKRALKDLHEIRQKKIINRAIFTSRSDMQLKDSTNMLKSEERLYGELVEDLKNGSINFLSEINNSELVSAHKQVEEPIVKSQTRSEPNSKMPSESEIQAPIQPENPPEAIGKPLKAPDQEPTILAKQMLVRFVEEVPQLKGIDLKIYGPFAKEDVANLPNELAEALIKQEKAKIIANG